MNDFDALDRAGDQLRVLVNMFDGLSALWNDSRYRTVNTRYLSPLRAEGQAIHSDLDQMRASVKDAERHWAHADELGQAIIREHERYTEHVKHLEEERKLSEKRSEEFRRHHQTATDAITQVQRFIQMANQD